MCAIQAIHALIEKDYFRKPKELKVSRLLFDAAYDEYRSLVWTLKGRVPTDSVPDFFKLYGVKIMPEAYAELTGSGTVTP